jgi:hypothetical protein
LNTLWLLVVEEEVVQAALLFLAVEAVLEVF